MRRLAFLLIGLLAVAAQAQDFPTRPIRMIVPYAPGGLPDTMTRIIGPKMSEALGQQIVVENRPGAGGISGTDGGARSAAAGPHQHSAAVRTHDHQRAAERTQ